MERIKVELRQIYVPKSSMKIRTSDDSTIKNIGESIKREGLIQPIVIRKAVAEDNVSKPYVLIDGRLRIEAHKKIEAHEIEAFVVEDKDVTDCAAMALSANAFRWPLEPKQQKFYVEAWYKRYAGDKPIQDPDEISRCKKGFVDFLASVMGTSKKTATRRIQSVKKFTKEQQEALDTQNITETMQEKVAGHPRAERDAIVNLICAGITAEEAIDQITQQVEGDTAAESEPEPEEETEEQLNERWYNEECHLRELLGGEQEKVYKKDCLLWKRIYDSWKFFQSKVRSEFQYTNEGQFTPLSYNLHRVVNMDHPKDWHLCMPCKGSGVVDAQSWENTTCNYCRGAGYIVATRKHRK